MTQAPETMIQSGFRGFYIHCLLLWRLQHAGIMMLRWLKCKGYDYLHCCRRFLLPAAMGAIQARKKTPERMPRILPGKLKNRDRQKNLEKGSSRKLTLLKS